MKAHAEDRFFLIAFNPFSFLPKEQPTREIVHFSKYFNEPFGRLRVLWLAAIGLILFVFFILQTTIFLLIVIFVIYPAVIIVSKNVDLYAIWSIPPDVLSIFGLMLIAVTVVSTLQLLLIAIPPQRYEEKCRVAKRYSGRIGKKIGNLSRKLDVLKEQTNSKIEKINETFAFSITDLAGLKEIIMGLYGEIPESMQEFETMEKKQLWLFCLKKWYSESIFVMTMNTDIGQHMVKKYKVKWLGSVTLSTNTPRRTRKGRLALLLLRVSRNIQLEKKK